MATHTFRTSQLSLYRCRRDTPHIIVCVCVSLLFRFRACALFASRQFASLRRSITPGWAGQLIPHLPPHPYTPHPHEPRPSRSCSTSQAPHQQAPPHCPPSFPPPQLPRQTPGWKSVRVIPRHQHRHRPVTPWPVTPRVTPPEEKLLGLWWPLCMQRLHLLARMTPLLTSAARLLLVGPLRMRCRCGVGLNGRLVGYGLPGPY